MVHGSPNVKGNYAPNEGPSGLMSLDGIREIRAKDYGTSGAGTKVTGGQRNDEEESSTPSGTLLLVHHPGVGPTKKLHQLQQFHLKIILNNHGQDQPGFFSDLTGGYRNLKTPGSTAGKNPYKSRFNPLAMILGLINPALGMAVKGFQGAGKGFGKKGLEV